MAKNGYVGIDGVARKIKTPYISVDGVARKVKKAYIGVNGVARIWYDYEKMLGEYSVGETVFLNMGGTLTEFRVVHQGIPNSTLYDSSCNGTWLMMTEGKYYHVWDSDNINTYIISDVHPYLNGDILAMFDSKVQNTIKQVKIPYGYYDEEMQLEPLVNSGADGLSCKIFLPSTSELGYDHSTAISFHARDGANLSYFADTSSDGADEKRVINGGGIDDIWWTRTCWGRSENFVYYVDPNGQFFNHGAVANHFIRPMMIMPPETKFDRRSDTFLG